MAGSDYPLTRSEQRTIAPARLHSYREKRYQGQEERVYLRQFADEDRQLLAAVYNYLRELYEALKPHHDNHTDCREALEAYVVSDGYQNLVPQMSHLGHATAALKTPADVSRLVHDLRGGAFQALAFRLQLFCADTQSERGLQDVYFLVRDHLKIMRNCVADLDPDRFEADSLTKNHNVDLLIEKWSQQDFMGADKPVHVALDCQFTGTICESCLEFASLDRIIYNLMNNAACYAADGRVNFYILPVPDERGDDVRFIIVNRVSEEHRQILLSKFHDDLGEIFRGGFTTNGHGLGTRICADFCAHAYGIFDFAKARHAGYFGARWAGDHFVTWFHWPRVGR